LFFTELKSSIDLAVTLKHGIKFALLSQKKTWNN